MGGWVGMGPRKLVAHTTTSRQAKMVCQLCSYNVCDGIGVSAASVEGEGTLRTGRDWLVSELKAPLAGMDMRNEDSRKHVSKGKKVSGVTK